MALAIRAAVWLFPTLPPTDSGGPLTVMHGTPWVTLITLGELTRIGTHTDTFLSTVCAIVAYTLGEKSRETNVEHVEAWTTLSLLNSVVASVKGFCCFLSNLKRQTVCSENKWTGRVKAINLQVFRVLLFVCSNYFYNYRPWACQAKAVWITTVSFHNRRVQAGKLAHTSALLCALWTEIILPS